MKKLALTVICTLVVSGVVLAQGNVNWGSIPTSAMSAKTNTTTYSPLFGGGAADGGVSLNPTTGAAYASGQAGTGFYWELLYSTYTGSQATISSLSSLLSWSDTGLGATNSSLSFLAGYLTPIAANTQATVPWAAGTTQNVVLVGWSSNLGTDWATVSAELNDGSYISALDGQDGFFGMTQTGYIAPNSANPGVTIFGTSSASYGLPINGVNTQLYLLPVPEPTTIALAGLGGLSLLLFRRRKV